MQLHKKLLQHLRQIQEKELVTTRDFIFNSFFQKSYRIQQLVDAFFLVTFQTPLLSSPLANLFRDVFLNRTDSHVFIQRHLSRRTFVESGRLFFLRHLLHYSVIDAQFLLDLYLSFTNIHLLDRFRFLVWFYKEIYPLNSEIYSEFYHISTHFSLYTRRILRVFEAYPDYFLGDGFDEFLLNSAHPESELQKAIRSDDVESLQKIAAQTPKFKDILIENTLFSPFAIPPTTPINYAAFFASSKCFQFLLERSKTEKCTLFWSQHITKVLMIRGHVSLPLSLQLKFPVEDEPRETDEELHTSILLLNGEVYPDDFELPDPEKFCVGGASDFADLYSSEFLMSDQTHLFFTFSTSFAWMGGNAEILKMLGEEYLKVEMVRGLEFGHERVVISILNNEQFSFDELWFLIDASIREECFEFLVELLKDNRIATNPNDQSFFEDLSIFDRILFKSVCSLSPSIMALILALYDTERLTDFCVLLGAIMYNREEMIELLFENHERLDVSDSIVESITNEGNTVLHSTIGDYDSKSVKIIWEAGKGKFDVNARNNEGKTPLIIAVQSGKMNNVEFMMEIETTNPNIQDDEGNTALHYVAIKNNREIFALLSSSTKVDSSLLNNKGKTAAELFEMKENN
jgi:hypothetical protein